MSKCPPRVPTPFPVFLAAALLLGVPGRSPATTTPLVETTAMLPSGDNDVADGICIWLHPTDASRSVVFGANKSEDATGGVYCFGVDGERITGGSWQAGVNWFADGKKINAADVRYNFPAGDETWDILCAANRTTDTIDVFRIDTGPAGDFAGLTKVGAFTPQHLDDDYPYGLAMFQPRSLSKHYVVASDKGGLCEQFELNYDAPTEQVTGTSVWHDAVATDGKEVEGIAADDEREVVYIASENIALYRYPTAGGVIQSAGQVTVDTTSGYVTADIENLAVYYGSGGAGYLFASSQGSDTFVGYGRPFAGSTANAHAVTFDIGTGDGIDRVTDTDGIAVTNANLGGAFAEGMFIAHDGGGPDDPTNWKFVAWSDVADETTPNLLIDTTWDPRSRNLVISADTVRAAAFAAADTVTVEGTLVLAGPSDCADLHLAPNGLVDVADASLLIRDGLLADILAGIADGRNGGTWDGNAGITSSLLAGGSRPDLAVGAAETDDGILVAVTLLGDADLDGDVDYRDYVALKRNFGSSDQYWAGGDFDYDGDVDFADYAFLRDHFGRRFPAPPTAPVPEPAAAALLAAGALLILRRPRTSAASPSARESPPPRRPA